MNGEELIWLTLCERLSVPSPAQLKRMISASEFIQWMVYLETEQDRISVDQVYLASIATECRRSYVKDPNKYTIKHFLSLFKKQQPESKKPQTREEAAAIAKASIFGSLGLSGLRKKE